MWQEFVSVWQKVTQVTELMPVTKQIIVLNDSSDSENIFTLHRVIVIFSILESASTQIESYWMKTLKNGDKMDYCPLLTPFESRLIVSFGSCGEYNFSFLLYIRNRYFNTNATRQTYCLTNTKAKFCAGLHGRSRILLHIQQTGTDLFETLKLRLSNNLNTHVPFQLCCFVLHF